MAIAFVAAGTRLKSSGSGSKSIPVPAGVLSGHLLLVVSVQNARFNEVPFSAGWNLLSPRAGRSDQTAFTPWPRTSVYWKIATGSEGANQTFIYPSGSYPYGSPTVILAYMLAYSGNHASAPVLDYGADNTVNPDLAIDHPIINVSTANSWLVTIRSTDAVSSKTFTISPADTERVDDFTGSGPVISSAYYDSNATVSTGMSTLRTTTASGATDYGNDMITLAIRPAAVAGATQAPAGLAEATGTAYDATVETTVDTWSTCVSGAAYSLAVDWNGDGDFTDTDEDHTAEALEGGVSISYGRDQERQLSPSSIGSMAYDLINTSGKYSPENGASPLAGDLDPAREARAQVTFNGITYPLFRGRIDDYDVKSDRSDRSVSFTFLDNQALLQNQKIDTELYPAIRVGAAIGIVLDTAGWTGPRDLDLGATFVPWWWVESQTALEAIQELIKSEGPPAIAYQSPDGTFVFRDRHHRLTRVDSRYSQATYAAAATDCATPPVTGTFHYTKPFVYKHGWRDIVNAATFEVGTRQPDPDYSAIWSTDSPIVLENGATLELDVSSSEPFMDAQDIVTDTDAIWNTAIPVTFALSRRSGQSLKLSMTAAGGTAFITFLQVRARAIPVVQTTKVSVRDPASITTHGEKSFPGEAPWVNANDAYALASTIVYRYAHRRPIIQMRVTSEDPDHFGEVVGRTVSDRITVINGDMGLSSDFFVERVAQTIRRMWSDKPPIHSTVLGCEKEPTAVPTNPFTFDKAGAGFDDGIFSPLGGDDPGSVFIFDDAVQGRFDYGVFAT